MSTRSTIAIQNDDGTVTGVYCHWNGYPDYNGIMLVTNYKAPSKVKNMIRLGDMSVLRSTWRIPVGETHNFDDPCCKVCIYYGRDRGENDVSPITCNDWSEFINKCGQEYNYLFSNGEWWIESNGRRETVIDRLKRMYNAEEIKQIKKNIKRY